MTHRYVGIKWWYLSWNIRILAANIETAHMACRHKNIMGWCMDIWCYLLKNNMWCYATYVLTQRGHLTSDTIAIYFLFSYSYNSKWIRQISHSLLTTVSFHLTMTSASTTSRATFTASPHHCLITLSLKSFMWEKFSTFTSII